MSETVPEDCGGLIVVAFDPGIQNVGMVAAEACPRTFVVRRYIAAERIDLTAMTHDRVSRRDCKLQHTNSLADRFAHFCQERQPLLERAGLIFAEQQPPLSAGCVFEQLLLSRFRSRTHTVHPRTIHTHFGIGHLDYEARKKANERYAAQLLREYGVTGRMHDVADALCVMTVGLEKLARDARIRAAAARVQCLEQYRFTGILPKRKRL